MGAPAAPGGVVDQFPDHDGRRQHDPGPVRVPGPPRSRPEPPAGRRTTGRHGQRHTAATPNTAMGSAVITSAATVKGVVAAAPNE